MKPALRGVGEKRKDAVGDLRSSPIMAEEDDLTAGTPRGGISTESFRF